MPYSTFKTIDDVREKLGVKIHSAESLFYNTKLQESELCLTVISVLMKKQQQNSN